MSSGRSFTTSFLTKYQNAAVSEFKKQLTELKKEMSDNKREQKELSKEIRDAQKEIKLINAEIKRTGQATDEQKKQCMGHYIDPGLRIVFNCGYPFQIFVQGDYAVPVASGDYYRTAKGHGESMASQYNIGGGIKINL